MTAQTLYPPTRGGGRISGGQDARVIGRTTETSVLDEPVTSLVRGIGHDDVRCPTFHYGTRARFVVILPDLDRDSSWTEIDFAGAADRTRDDRGAVTVGRQVGGGIHSRVALLGGNGVTHREMRCGRYVDVIGRYRRGLS